MRWRNCGTTSGFGRRTSTSISGHWDSSCPAGLADPPQMTCNAFVLGGGGVLGAAEVGMARALLEAGVIPDLVCGTSIGAINGAAIAADPTAAGAERLLAMWDRLADNGFLDGSLIRRVIEVTRRRT